MKRTLLYLLSLIFLLTGCSQLAQTAPEPTPEPTPNPLETYSGEWTWEFGDGSVVWELYDDGRFLVPEQTYDTYYSIAGYGTWRVEKDCLMMTLAADFPLRIIEEDGFSKLYCPLLNQTLVRCTEREAAYAAKYVDVQLTSENVWDYFRLEQVPSPVDENGERIYKEVFVMRNVQYDNGLLFWSESDVHMDFIYWTTYHLRAEKAPYGLNFYVNNFNSVTADGCLTFIRSDHVAEYTYDGEYRCVALNSGETKTELFEGFRYGDYPY